MGAKVCPFARHCVSWESAQGLVLNGRPVGTRTPDLYRVKAALLCTANNFKAVRSGLSTCKCA